MKKIPAKNQLSLDKAPQAYVYTTSDIELAVTVSNDDIWLSQKQMAQLFGVNIRTANEHINNVIRDDKLTDSVIRDFRITASDGKSYKVQHYGLDIIIPVGYRVGSPQATEFRKWANGIIKQFLLVGYAINQKRIGSKSLLKMEDDLSQLERHSLTTRPEYQRLSRVYENKQGEELLFAIIADICLDPNYGQIKGAEYKYLFGMIADDLKAALGSKSIRQSLPDRQLSAFTLAEATLRMMLGGNSEMTNEEVLEAVRRAFVPIGNYLRETSNLMGLHHVTDKPLLPSGAALT